MMMSSRIAPLCLFLSAGACVSAEAQSPELGYGYPGRLDPYDISVELKSRLDKFGMTAGWFRRDAVSADDLQSAVLQVSYKSEWSKSAIEEIAGIVRRGGGDFRRSTFPDGGHDSWSKAWQEDVVWEWVFSKSVRRERSCRDAVANGGIDAFAILSLATCSASIPGVDDRHGPERISDGLDATTYVSARPPNNGDWVMLCFPCPIKGRFLIASGFSDGRKKLFRGTVECSNKGSRWRVVGKFSAKTGDARFVLEHPADRIRIVFDGKSKDSVVLRKISSVRR